MVDLKVNSAKNAPVLKMYDTFGLGYEKSFPFNLSDSVVYATNQDVKFFQLKNDVNADKKESSSIDLKTETSQLGSTNSPDTEREVKKLKSAEKKKKREKLSQ